MPIPGMMRKCAPGRGSNKSKGSEEEPDYKFEEEKGKGRVVVSRCGHSVVNRRQTGLYRASQWGGVWALFNVQREVTAELWVGK